MQVKYDNTARDDVLLYKFINVTYYIYNYKYDLIIRTWESNRDCSLTDWR